jgi:VanZ family protein
MMRWLRLWWPALTWAALISIFSTGAFSAPNTGRIILPLLHWLLPHSSPETLASIHFLIRKSGHFTEYFIFSLLVLRGIRAGKKEAHLGWAAAAVAIVAAYAALDEFHQSFVPRRTAAVGDVLLDMAGGVAAQLIAALFLYWSDVRLQHRQERKNPV